jgi:hypothetical protein
MTAANGSLEDGASVAGEEPSVRLGQLADGALREVAFAKAGSAL